MSLSDRAKSIYSNSRQLASQYNKKRQNVEDSALKILYKPFEAFDADKYQAAIEFTEKIVTNNIMDAEQYQKLILLSEEIMNLSLEGLDYYQNYYQRPLLVAVTLSFMGWILCLVKLLLKQKNYTQVESSITSKCNYRNGNIMRYLTASNLIFLILFLIPSYLIFGNY